MASKKETEKKTQEIEISSVRSNRTSIHIQWKQGSDDYSVAFHDNPRKSFYDAVAALVPHVVTLAELNAKDEAKITATGITVRAKGDNLLALIVAQKKLKRNGRVLNVATPLIAMYQNEEDKGADHMTDAEAGAIEKVIKEAKKYIGGDREQGQIEYTDPEAPEKEDNTEAFPELKDDPSPGN